MSEHKDSDEELNALKENAKQSLEDLVVKKLPEKIIQIERLIAQRFDLEKQPFVVTNINIPVPNKRNSGQTSEAPPIEIIPGLDKRVFLFANGLHAINEHIWQLMACVKPLLLDFVSDIRVMKFSVQLMVPKVEDGNNFGVQIQHSLIYGISKAEGQVSSCLDQFNRYYVRRGDIISSIARFPHCDDYRRCLREEDQRFYLFLCLIVRQLRDDCVSLNDVFVKNWQQIQNPRHY